MWDASRVCAPLRATHYRPISRSPYGDCKARRTSQPKLSDDPLNMKGIQKVIIVGNGVAGITVAEALRVISKSVEITILTDEPHHFNNRMAIGRMLYGGPQWTACFCCPRLGMWNIESRSGAVPLFCLMIASSDLYVWALARRSQYDRLVLATGADAIVPAPDTARFINTFVLRSATDAQAIRMWVQQSSARQAVAIGGGVLGVEAAKSLHNLGLRVVLLQRSSPINGSASRPERGAEACPIF